MEREAGQADLNGRASVSPDRGPRLVTREQPFINVDEAASRSNDL